MVATSEDIARRNELRLEAVWEMTQDMDEVAAEWQDLADWERASYALEWDNYAGAVRNMIADFHQGRMAPRQQRNLLPLLRRLDELQPIFVRLHLSCPDVRSMAMLYEEEAASPTRRSYS